MIGRINSIIIVLQLGGFAACMLAARDAGTLWGLALVALVFAALMNSIYSTIHEAEHGILFENPVHNDGAGVFMSLLFPAPFHLIRQGHLGHHIRNRSDDEAFDYYFEGERPAWKRLQWYGILCGFYWAVVALSNLVVLFAPFLFRRSLYSFDRPSTAFMDSLNPRYWKFIKAEAMAAIVLHMALILGLGIPAGRYLLLYAAFGVSWSSLQYVHHFGTVRDVLRGARNLWIFAPLDWFWLHHNWHLTHHKHPTVPWLQLPKRGREEDPEREFLPKVYLRMWKGPRRATERVENRYAGKIVR